MKYFKLFIIILISKLFISHSLFAADDIGDPTTYEVTMKKVELCTSSACTTSTVLAETDGTFDIVSSTAGAM